MNQTPIAQLLTLPNDTQVESVQGQIVEVYKRRNTANGKTVQDGKLRDSSGHEIKISVWEHDDITPLKGREVMIQAGPKGGVRVVLDTYRQPHVNSLSVSKTGTFQFLEVHRANAGIPAPAREAQGPATAAPSAPVVVNGAKVGMALNNACLFLTNAGKPFDSAQVHAMASEIVRLSNEMENGNLIPYNPF